MTAGALAQGLYYFVSGAWALLHIESLHVYKGVISPVYGLDAAAEAVFIIWWLACLTL